MRTPMLLQMMVNSVVNGTTEERCYTLQASVLSSPSVRACVGYSLVLQNTCIFYDAHADYALVFMHLLAMSVTETHELYN